MTIIWRKEVPKQASQRLSVIELDTGGDRSIDADSLIIMQQHQPTANSRIDPTLCVSAFFGKHCELMPALLSYVGNRIALYYSLQAAESSKQEILIEGREALPV